MLKSLFYKVASLQVCSVIKKRLIYRCFPLKFEKFLKTPILKNIWMTAFVYWLLHQILILTIHYWTRFSFLQKRLYYAIKTIELMTREAVSFEEVLHWTKLLWYSFHLYFSFTEIFHESFKKQFNWNLMLR